MKRILALLLIVSAISAVCWTLPPAASQPGPDAATPANDSDEPEVAAPPLLPATRDHTGAIRLVFFSVLEGLYLDGVRQETVERLLMKDPETGEPMHFVPGCPLCMPALDAIRLYSQRPGLSLLFKNGMADDTFGPGLAASVREKLDSDSWQVRLEAVRDLVKRWVAQRLSMLRLTEAELAEWKQLMQDLAEKGNAMMMEWSRRLENRYPAKTCAVCEGAADSAGSLRLDDDD